MSRPPISSVNGATAHGLTRRSLLSAVALSGVASAASADRVGEDAALAWQPRRLTHPLLLGEVHTPALYLDEARVEANLKRMAGLLKERGVGLRPHVKTHKCPHLAYRQMARGAVGICCAKLSEAEVMADAGIERILVTSPVVTREKIARAIALAARCSGFQIVVDHARNATDFAEAAEAAGIRIAVLIDLVPGVGRTGVPVGDEAVALARHVAGLKHLRLEGVQCYAGRVMHVADFDTRRTRSRAVLEPALETRARIEREGIPLPIFSCGGTGTCEIDSALDGVTDLQCGSYPVMDVQYGLIDASQGRMSGMFRPAMFVLSTAISQNVEERITVDAGGKAIYRDEPNSEVHGISGVSYHPAGDEHGILMLENPSRPVRLGDKLSIIPVHCDPTINLYDCFHVVRDGQVVERWPISARGMSQ